ncbi:hypothetical protein J5N97_004640 [Dioscorea zingiberensis]|uniref:Serine-threonine/tyrosine-protein kinase catalytic domain-containing protein n=1 Tax=Dioscorea zingiberensis TaxID=325984 RepID=A0A9D5HRP3_9LILI|nr:hypothetical protein J5N97_004640 [Dioscorea zingiberensis]
MLPHGEKEFITEVTTIGSMHHMNLVGLCGFCSEGSHRLLVYEYMSNGSLDKWIFPSYDQRDKKLLDWKTRFEIAISIAQDTEERNNGPSVERLADCLSWELEAARIMHVTELGFLRSRMLTTVDIAGLSAGEGLVHLRAKFNISNASSSE